MATTRRDVTKARSSTPTDMSTQARRRSHSAPAALPAAAPSTAAATRSDDLRRSSTSATLDDRVERCMLTHAASVGQRPQHLGDTSAARSVSAAWMAAAMSGGHRHAVAALPTPSALLPLLLPL